MRLHLHIAQSGLKNGKIFIRCGSNSKTTEINLSYLLHWKNVDFNSLRKQYGLLKIELFSDLGRTVHIVALKLNECRQPSHKIHHTDLFLLKIRKNALGERHSATKDIKNVWVEDYNLIFYGFVVKGTVEYQRKEFICI